MIIIKIDAATDYLRKLIRVLNITTETKIAAMHKKLDIGQDELATILEETKNNLTKSQLNDLESDIKDVSR